MVEWIISGGVLILVIAALRYVLRGKISLRLQYALWALVLIRLLVPVSFGGSGISVMNAVPNDVSAAILSLGVPEGAYPPPENASAELPAPAAPGTQLISSDTYNGVTNESAAVIDWGQIALYVWLGGITAVGLCLVAANLRFALKLKRSRQRLDIGECKLPVYESALVETPCMFGLFRPAIYVTPDAAQSETTMRHVLAHELTHYSHGDHIWSALRGVCLALHWYNPLVWLAAALSRRDAELACDESTIRRIGEDERSEYGRTLIGMTCQKRAALLITATTMTGNKSSIRERIILIAKKPKMATYTLITVVLIAAVAVGCTFTGAKSETDDVVLYDCGGYSIAVPSEYIDQLIIHTGNELENDNALISIFEKASVEAAIENGIDDSGLGWLFSIIRYNRVQYEQYLRADGSGFSFFAKDEEWYYGYCFPTDVRYYRSGDRYMVEAERNKWNTLNDQMGPWVRDDFTQRNDLIPHSDDEERSGYTYDGDHKLLNYYPYYSVNGSKNEVYTLVLSQPATQGEGGIWCVERMLGDYGNVILWFPDSGIPALDYYAAVQAEHDAGARRDHADVYSAAATFLAESGYFNSAVIDGSLEPAGNSPDNIYNQAWIYDLFDVGGSMDIGLVIEGDMMYNTYTVDSRWYAERYDVLMSSYIWTLLENDSADPADLWATAPYYITVVSAESNVGFTFFGDNNIACYRSGDAVAWYNLTYKYDGGGFLAAEMRAEYDSQDVNFKRINFYYDGTPELAAELLVQEIFGKHMLGLAPGGIYSITDYQVVEWGVMEVSEDEAAIVGWFEYAVIPENFNSPGLWAGNTTEGTGEQEGWLVMYRQFVLQRQEDGYWHCIDFGTGGASLPE